MRLAAYSGASIALAVGVIIYAFNERANFYSACVYLAQSNLCLMILTNLMLFITTSFLYGLQRTFYGPLRPIEIEQLYEKAWFAVTETCLAMTIFREEVGAWFLVMFVALLAGKVWSWIGEGRVEILEQQPPANPRLFHLRLSFSLALSVLYDIWIMAYTIRTVIQLARPNMMVMFLFEFAILTTSSFSTVLRYAISLIEAGIVQKQTQELLQARRQQIREEREELLRRREAASAEGSSETVEPLPSEDDVDEMDIEAPGWESKGQWILSLDLATDFVKLGIYSAFFFILLTFYGLPIHIMRDLFLTARSFVRRLTAFIKYRNATRDMMRYPDATAEEIQREDTCIICREEMRPWSVTNPAGQPGPANAAPQSPNGRPPTAPIVNERYRPKKLPCGHVLHLGCLKSWLERQQVCPTCRRPVVDNSRTPAGPNQRPGQGAPAQLPGQPPVPGAGAGAGGQGQAPAAQPNGAVGGVINIGPLRLNFGRGPMPNPAQAFGGGQPGQPGQPNALPANARVYGLEFGFPRLQPQAQAQAPAQPVIPPGTTIQAQLQQIEQQIMQDIQSLAIHQAQLQTVQNLQAELSRLRQMQNNLGAQHPQNVTQVTPSPTIPSSAGPSAFQRLGPQPGNSAIPSGSSELPAGVTIPEGWTLLPLQSLDSMGVAQPNGLQPAPVPNGMPTSQWTIHHSNPNTNPTTTQPVTGPAATAGQSDAPPSSSAGLSHRITHPDPNTPTAPNSSAPVVEASESSQATLPNWGTSQFFRGPTATPGKSTREINGHVAETNSAKASVDTEQPSAASQSENAGEETKQDKGKGKAVTVEDDLSEDA